MDDDGFLKDILGKTKDGTTVYPYKMSRGESAGHYTYTLNDGLKRRRPCTEEELRTLIETGRFKHSGKISMIAASNRRSSGSAVRPLLYKGKPISEIGLTKETHVDREAITALKKRKFKPSISGGGEGPAHKLLKQYVLDNPNEVSVVDVIEKETEYALPSGDRLDVFFQTDQSLWAVEVKSAISNSIDVMRGIFQCIKYRAVMEAHEEFIESGLNVEVCLVLEGEMPAELISLARKNNVNYFDGVKPNPYF